MGLQKINKWERAVVLLLNLDGWDLKWTGEGFTHWDAEGKTPKGFDCVIEMKFRTKYYSEKMLKNIIKLYFVNDPKGNFMYWLNTLKMPIPIKKYCPDTTMWTKKRLLKDVYLLKENEASRININIS